MAQKRGSVQSKRVSHPNTLSLLLEQMVADQESLNLVFKMNVCPFAKPLSNLKPNYFKCLPRDASCYHRATRNCTFVCAV